jgi:hypothetical protein
MTVNVYTHRLNSKCYVRVVAPAVDITYTPAPPLGYLCRTVLPLDLSDYQITSHYLGTSIHPYATRTKSLLAEAASGIKAIAMRLELPGIHFDRLGCFSEFADRVTQHKLTGRQHLDLSDLGLKLLPFQISLFREVRTLDLQNNALRIVPIDLLALPHLEVVDLRKNPIVELPKWCCRELPGVEFLTDIIKDREESPRSMMSVSDDDQQASFQGSVACCDDVGA